MVQTNQNRLGNVDVFVSHLPTFKSWLIAFVATIFLEGGIVFVYAKIFKQDAKHYCLANFVGNTFSHPTAFLIIVPLLRSLNVLYSPAILVAEGCVVVMETIVFRRLLKTSLLRSFLTALLINLTSWQFGNILWKWIY